MKLDCDNEEKTYLDEDGDYRIYCCVCEKFCNR